MPASRTLVKRRTVNNSGIGILCSKNSNGRLAIQAVAGLLVFAVADIVLLWPVWLRPIWFVVDMVAPPFNLAHPVDCRKTIVWPRCRSLQQTDGFHVTTICECLLVTLAITDAVWFCSHEVLSSPGCPCIISYTDTGLGRHLYYHTVTSSRVEGDGDCRMSMSSVRLRDDHPRNAYETFPHHDTLYFPPPMHGLHMAMGPYPLRLEYLNHSFLQVHTRFSKQNKLKPKLS